MSIPNDHAREASGRGIYDEAPLSVWLPQAGQVDPALTSTPHSPSSLAADEEGTVWMGKRRACRFCNKDQAATVVGRHEESCEENENRILGKYVCKTCGTRFNRADSRTRHRKSARKKGSCPKPKARSTHSTPSSSTQPYPTSSSAQSPGRDSQLIASIDGSSDWLNRWEQALSYHHSTRQPASSIPYPATHQPKDIYQPQSPGPPQTSSSSLAFQNPTAQLSSGHGPSATPEAFDNAPLSQDWTRSYPKMQYRNHTHQLLSMIPPNSIDRRVPSAPTQPPGPSVAMTSNDSGEFTTPQPDQLYTALFGTSHNGDTIAGGDQTPTLDGSISEQDFEDQFQLGIVGSNFPGIISYYNNPNHLTTIQLQQGIDHFDTSHYDSIIVGEEMALTSGESKAGWGVQDQFPGTLDHSFSDMSCQRQDRHYHPYESYHP